MLTVEEITEKAKRVRLLILDIDGVLTDGRIIYGNQGEEFKFFDVQDGFGITLIKRFGIPSAIVTAKKSRLVKKRAKELKVSALYQNAFRKIEAFEKILKKFRIKPDEICFVGDDIIDLPILHRVGLAIAVPNAVEEVKEAAHYITKQSGGRGAVREVCDLLLKSQNKWPEATSRYR